MGSVVVPALVAGIGLLGGLGLTALAAVLRIGDRSLPRWLVPLLTVAFGLGASIAIGVSFATVLAVIWLVGSAWT